MIRLFIFLFLSASLYAQDWPKRFVPSEALGAYKALEKSGGFHRYQSQHYTIETREKLPPHLLKKLVKVSEAVAIAMGKVPLPLLAPSDEDLPIIRIVKEEEEFLQLGGPLGAAGIYDGRKREILIRSDQFFLQGKGSANFNILVHELVHLHMHSLLWKCPPWFTEGVADYFVAAHLGQGAFRFTDMKRRIPLLLKKRRLIGENHLDVISFAEVAELNEKDWSQRVELSKGWEAMEVYSSALVMVHYYFHGGKKHRAEVKKYLDAIQQVERRRRSYPTLLKSGEINEMQKKVVGYWKKQGLHLKVKSEGSR